METIFEPLQAARFLRTLRVATGVAISQDEIRRGRGRATPAATLPRARGKDRRTVALSR